MKVSIIFSACILFFSFTGCTKQGSSVTVNNSEAPVLITNAAETSIETPKSKTIRCDIYVFANRQLTNVKVKFLRDLADQTFASQIGNPRVYFNDFELDKLSEDSEIIEFGGKAEGYLAQSRITLNIQNIRYDYTMHVEPLDFGIEEPFTFHRLQSNTIPLSRKYTEEEGLWLSIFDSQIGAFKEVAKFDDSRSSIVIPGAVSERMSIGDAKIQLHNVGWLNQQTTGTPVEISMTVEYRSEISLRVIR